MPTDSTCFHVAVILPSDTTEEVEGARRAVSKLSDELSRKGVTLAFHHWSRLPPGIGEPQGYIDENIAWADVDFVVGFMRQKFGSPVADAASGTEHEVKIVLDQHAKTGSPELLFYFHSEATHGSQEVSQFAAELRQKAVTGSYSSVAELENVLAEHIRLKVEKNAAPPTGVPKSFGTLPANRRLTVEWMMGAQMREGESPIATIIVFKNGLGDEYIFDSREMFNMQGFCNWVFKSMGFDAKANDTLIPYLLQTNAENLKNRKPAPAPIQLLSQLWLGNMCYISHRKLGKVSLKLAICRTLQTTDQADQVAEVMKRGLIAVGPKHIRINEKGEKEYLL